MEHTIRDTLLNEFKTALKEDEKSSATIEKYLRDVKAFLRFAGHFYIEKETVIRYKQHLQTSYTKSSANSMLVALNRFFKFAGWHDCVVKAFKVQQESFRAKERELTKAEYFRLLVAAKRTHKQRLYLVMQSICSTGIRVSELKFITVEALRTHRATVSLKGKTRTVILPRGLCDMLASYATKHHINSGSVFITSGGKPLDRSNILHEMKALAEAAGVDRRKIFPHNLRHLFAVTYYEKKKDLGHLADVLGHSNINTTRIYTLVSCDEQEKQIEALGLVYLSQRQKTTA